MYRNGRDSYKTHTGRAEHNRLIYAFKVMVTVTISLLSRAFVFFPASHFAVQPTSVCPCLLSRDIQNNTNMYRR